jgi:hypothetical protein
MMRRTIRGVDSLYVPRRTRLAEMQRQSDIMVTTLQLIASIDDKLEGLCRMANVPVEDDGSGDAEIRPLRGDRR